MFKVIFLLSLFFFVGLFPGAAQTISQTVPPQDIADDGGQFIDVDGFSIYYLDEGNPDAPTVIFLHGFGGSTFTWRDAFPAVTAAGYRAIAYDRPPFGLSQKSRDVPMNPSDLADQLAALMDALNIQSATLVGHSAGGGVISYFAVQHPQRIDALVFVAGAVALPAGFSPASDSDSEQSSGGSPLGGLGSLAANMDFENPAASQLIGSLLTPERFMGILLGAYAPDFDLTDDIIEGYTRVLQVDNWPEGFIAIFTNQDAPPPLDVDSLAAVGAQTPTAIIWGEIDTWVPLSRGQALNTLIPSARWIVYPGVAHMPMEENVDGFNADLLLFLSEVYTELE